MKVPFIALFIVFSVYAHAQMPGGGQGQGPGPGKGQAAGDGLIIGRILESGTNTPMEFVHVVLYRSGDSSVVTGSITDQAGKYTLKELPYGRFYLTAKFVGYESKTIDSLFLNPQRKMIDAGTMQLDVSAQLLDGVEIVGDRDRVTYQVDKKIVNVSQDLKSAGGTAIDVLENVPSVKVDIEGNVTMRGSGNFTVLVDGRPSVLESSDALQQIPAAAIDHIEIITNPSVKYDPDGTAGIINVITKKSKTGGLNGIVNASAGTRNKYSADILLNYRAGKFNVFGGADFRVMNFRGEGESEDRTSRGDTTEYRMSDSEGRMNRDGYGFKAGFDYFINPQTTFTLSGKYGVYGFGRDRDANMTFFTDPESVESYTRSFNSSERSGDFYEVTANYVKNIDERGQKLEVMGFFSSRTGDDSEEQQEYATDSAWSQIAPPDDQVYTVEVDQSFDYLLKADYVLPFTQKSKMESGVQARFYRDDEQYDFFEYDTLQNAWVEDNLYSNDVDFRRDIFSAYSTYSNEWKGFGFQLGLRGEYAYRSIKNAQSAEASVLDRFDLFPSAHISRALGERHELMLSYSRRINRVRAQMLDPFISYQDPYNIRQGNPDLKDEYIDSYDLGYQFKLEKSFFAFDAYYRMTHNLISRVTTLQDDGILLTTFENQNKDYSLGSELSWNGDVTRWLNVFAMTDLYYYRLKGESEGEPVDDETFSWDARLTLSMKFKYDLRFQLTGSYEGPEITVQGTEEGTFMSSVSVRKDFFERKLSLTLTGRDIFRSAKMESTSSGDGFYNYSLVKRESPVFMLNVSYRINNYRQQNRQDGMERNGDDDMDL